MFPILPRSPESLSSSLICSRNTIPEKKQKKWSLYEKVNLKFANTTYLKRVDMNSKITPRQYIKSLKKYGIELNFEYTG